MGGPLTAPAELASFWGASLDLGWLRRWKLLFDIESAPLVALGLLLLLAVPLLVLLNLGLECLLLLRRPPRYGKLLFVVFVFVCWLYSPPP